jgi:hypothetical protein
MRFPLRNSAASQLQITRVNRSKLWRGGCAETLPDFSRIVAERGDLDFPIMKLDIADGGITARGQLHEGPAMVRQTLAAQPRKAKVAELNLFRRTA